MASGKEIRTKIGSIKNTEKITRAMGMVAASKMRKTQERMRATRPYSRKIAQIISHLAQANPEYKHAFLIEREIKKTGIILVSSDRGLCGGLNSNLFRVVLKRMKQWESGGVGIGLSVIGRKGAGFFSAIGAEITAQTSGLGDAPHLEDVIGVIKVMLDAFEAGEIDVVSIAYNDFVNTMTQKPTIQQILPIHRATLVEELKRPWDYIYEPDAKDMLDGLLSRYVESIAYQGVVENNACEQAARMVAMQSASDNAGKLIEELELIYNKARQASITQEISEIVGGAAAV